MGLMTMLVKRGSTYYWRQRVPTDLVDSIGKNELKISLRTKDAADAKSRCKAVITKVDEYFQLERTKSALTLAEREEWLLKLKDSGLIDASVKDIDPSFLESLLEKTLADSEQGAVRQNQKLHRILLTSMSDFNRDNPQLSADDRRKAEAAVNELTARLAEVQSPYQYAKDGELLANVLKAFGKDAPVTIHYPEEHPQLKRARIAHKGSSDAPLISEMLEQWKRERNAGPLAQQEWETTVRRFTELCGDLPITQIEKAHIRQFKDALMQLPTRLPSEYRKAPLPEVLQAVRDGKCKAGTALRAGTINKMMSAISSILSLAVDNGYIETNVAQRIRLPEDKRRQDKRLPYEVEDLKLLFHSPLYVGCQSKHQRDLKGNIVIRDHKFWLPLIALYTGARQEEIGQSLLSDIGHEDGIYYLDINSVDEGKSLKTLSSRRKVPLHTELIRCGFVQYVEKLKASGEKKLFPELNKDQYGKSTRPFSKWYNRYTNDIGITDKRKVFHSFRHAFKDACRNAEVEEAIHDALTGHTNGSVGRSYGKGHSLKILDKALQRIDYGLDLRHLHVKV